MDVPSRIELLKHNLRRFIHDLLHYDVIEVRLLNRKTGELKPLLEDGMLPKPPAGSSMPSKPAMVSPGSSHSQVRVIFARTPPTTRTTSPARGCGLDDGASKFQDEVIGTLNVESPRERIRK